MLETQKYLLAKGLESLSNKFSISCKRHKKYPNLVQLKYSQLESKMSKRIVQECRGLILDEANDWAIVCYPFDKFFNYSESNAAKLNWNNSEIFEKLDGSLMMLYFYDNQWIVASSGLPDATGYVKNQDYTLKDLFWKIWQEEKYEMPKDVSSCYMFEMTDPSTKILVPYEKGSITLIGARNLKSLKEYSIDEVANKEWRKVKRYPLKSLEELVEDCKGLNPMKCEGFVVCDNEFKRVKMKSPQYVKLNLLHGADEKLTDRYLIDIIQANEGDEFLVYFENYRSRYNELKIKYQNLIVELEKLYKEVKDMEDRREIGLRVRESKFPTLFFQLKDGKVNSIKDYIRNQDSKHIVKFL